MILLRTNIIYYEGDLVMTKIEPIKLTLARERLKKKKVFTLPMLETILKCSYRTCQTKLKMWKTYTSYNKNGRYYVLPEIPRFDKNGIWRYKDIAFSRHGNLKKTIIQLVNTSTAGLSGSELGNILGLSPQSFVHHFRGCSGICREKHGGVYIHFSDQPDKHKQQVQRRIADLVKVVKKDAVAESDAIIILVAIIKHHGIGLEDILMLPEIKKSKLSRLAIQNFMASHGLLKKTPVPKP